MPTEEDDNDHAVIATTTLSATTTSLPFDPAATKTEALPTVNPSDHPDRPVNSKPTETTSSTTISATASATDTTPAQEAETTAPSTWLPSFLPTFGVSGRTQVWIYGSVGLIAVFCSGLGVYFYMARRRRVRNGEARADYESELLDDEEAEGLNSGEKGRAGKNGKAGRRTRGGELYDAFAGGSDDDDEDDEYRDRAYNEMMGVNGESTEEMSEKTRTRRSEDDDGSDESDQHVVGDDDDEEEEDAPLRSTGR